MPTVAEAFTLALQHHQAGNLRQAEQLYQQILQVRPDYPEAHNNLANALRCQGRLQEAVTHCREALRWRPSFAEAHNNLGTALAELGRIDEAIASLRAALAC